MSLEYTVNKPISPEAFIDVLGRSSLAERRPVDDPECIAGMLKHADLLVCAWDGERLVGVSRCKLILLAAPAARAYYPRHDSCWIVDSDAPLGKPAAAE